VIALAEIVVLFTTSAKGGETSAKGDKTSAKGGKKTAVIADFQGAAPVFEFAAELFMRKEAKRGTIRKLFILRKSN
jgi:hypothetical protein